MYTEPTHSDGCLACDRPATDSQWSSDSTDPAGSTALTSGGDR